MSARRTVAAHACIAPILKSGECAIDATVGNGHDTLFLADLVGAQGHVWGFDVQSVALAGTARRLEAHASGRGENVTLIHASHDSMGERIPGNRHGHIGAIMFNLGYLPGGDKTLTTMAASTLRALSSAGELLRPGGIVTVMGYVGHEAGQQEVDALLSWIDTRATTLSWREHEKGAAPATAPRLFIGVKDQG